MFFWLGYTLLVGVHPDDFDDCDVVNTVLDITEYSGCVLLQVLIFQFFPLKVVLQLGGCSFRQNVNIGLRLANPNYCLTTSDIQNITECKGLWLGLGLGLVLGIWARDWVRARVSG